jgi:hypothetical protein
MGAKWFIRQHDEMKDWEAAISFMEYGRPGDELIAINDRQCGLWVERDLLVTRIASASAIGLAMLNHKRKNILWINLDYDPSRQPLSCGSWQASKGSANVHTQEVPVQGRPACNLRGSKMAPSKRIPSHISVYR